MSYILPLVRDNLVWTLLLVPLFYILYELYRVIEIVFKVYKNNRNGYGNGISKHFGDRFLEIYKKTSGNEQIKYGESSFSNINHGTVLWNIGNTCHQADDFLIEKGLIIRHQNNSIHPDIEFCLNYTCFRHIGNYLVYRILKIISVNIYRDKVDFFTDS